MTVDRTTLVGQASKGLICVCAFNPDGTIDAFEPFMLSLDQLIETCMHPATCMDFVEAVSDLLGPVEAMRIIRARSAS